MNPAANGSQAGAPSARKKARQKSAPSGRLTSGGATTIAGPKTSTGTSGDTRRARSTREERDRGGEARSLSVREGFGESTDMADLLGLERTWTAAHGGDRTH